MQLNNSNIQNSIYQENQQKQQNQENQENQHNVR